MAQSDPCKIAVYSESKFLELGYQAVTHPDGYIYFEKTKELDCAEENSEVNVKIEGNSSFEAEHADDQHDLTSTTSHGQENDGTENNQISSTIQSDEDNSIDEIPADNTDEAVAEEILDSAPEVELTKRKLRGDPSEKLEENWDTALEDIGHCKCYFSTCNFISLTLSCMSRHFKYCTGEPSFNTNLCTRCGCWLVSSRQRDTHAESCSGAKFGFGKRTFARLNSTTMPAGPATVPKELIRLQPIKPKENSGNQPPVPKQSHFQVASKLNFPCKICGSTNRTFSSAKICTHNSSTKEVSSVIIQPVPNIPVGSYVRRRSYSGVHVEAWNLQLKEKRCIACHREGCRFLAMSTEDMCTHYGYCIGDSTFASFRCTVCQGAVTSKSLLNLHMRLSHHCPQATSSSIPPPNAPPPIRIVSATTIKPPVFTTPSILKRASPSAIVTREVFKPAILKRSANKPEQQAVVKAVPAKTPVITVRRQTSPASRQSSTYNLANGKVVSLRCVPLQDRCNFVEPTTAEQDPLQLDDEPQRMEIDTSLPEQTAVAAVEDTVFEVSYLFNSPPLPTKAFPVVAVSTEELHTAVITEAHLASSTAVHQSSENEDNGEKPIRRQSAGAKLEENIGPSLSTALPITEPQLGSSVDQPCQDAVKNLSEEKPKRRQSARNKLEEKISTEDTLTADVIEPQLGNSTMLMESVDQPCSNEDKLKKMSRETPRRQLSARNKFEENIGPSSSEVSPLTSTEETLTADGTESQLGNSTMLIESVDQPCSNEENVKKMSRKTPGRRQSARTKFEENIGPSLSEVSPLVSAEETLAAVVIKTELASSSVSVGQSYSNEDMSRGSAEAKLDEQAETSSASEVLPTPVPLTKSHHHEICQNMPLKSSESAVSKPKRRQSARAKLSSNSIEDIYVSREIPKMRQSARTKLEENIGPSLFSEVPPTAHLEETEVCEAKNSEMNRNNDTNYISNTVTEHMDEDKSLSELNVVCRPKYQTRRQSVTSEIICKVVEIVGEKNVEISLASGSDDKIIDKVTSTPYPGSSEQQENNNVIISNERVLHGEDEEIDVPDTLKRKRVLASSDDEISMDNTEELPEISTENKAKAASRYNKQYVKKPVRVKRRWIITSSDEEVSKENEKDLPRVKQEPTNPLKRKRLPRKKAVESNEETLSTEWSKKISMKLSRPSLSTEIHNADFDSSLPLLADVVTADQENLNADNSVKATENDSSGLKAPTLPLVLADKPRRPSKRMKPETEDYVLEGNTEIEDELVIVKVGKPKKPPPIVIDCEAEEDMSLSVIARNEIEKRQSEPTPVNMDASIETVQPNRRVGRHKRVIPDYTEESEENTEEYIEPTPVKSRRGRPKRVVIENIETPDSKEEKERLFTQPTPVKNRVGRPKKKISEDIEIKPVAEPEGMPDGMEVSAENESLLDEPTPVKKKRGRPKRIVAEVIDAEPDAVFEPEEDERKPSLITFHRPPVEGESLKKQVQCAKCKTVLMLKQWDNHNGREHAGISWIEGETPIDLKTVDPEHLMLLLRSAWKLCQKIKCEQCGVLKKSFLGYHAHLLYVCGKSSEEQKQLMTECKECGRSVLPYSMPSHERTHLLSGQVAIRKKEEEAQKAELELPITGKRRSAIKAISTFKQVLEQAEAESTCAFYKKGDPYLPLDSKMKGRILATKRCMRKKCRQSISPEMRLEHFYTCHTLPDQYYQCVDCIYYATNEAKTAHNCTTSSQDDDDDKEEGAVDPFADGDNSEDEAYEFEEEGEDENEESEKSEESFGEEMSDDESHTPRRSKKPAVRPELHFGRRNFISRENITQKNEFVLQNDTVQLEWKARNCESEETGEFPSFTTSPDDWVSLPDSEAAAYLPPLHTSLPFHYADKTFHMDLFQAYEDLSGVFVGGPVTAMGWCNISKKRAAKTDHYLALSVSSYPEKYPSLQSDAKNALLQIWNYGTLCATEKDSRPLPYLEFALALDHGQLWDLTWSPIDTYDELSKRIGLLAASFQDGYIRIYAISQREPKSDEATSHPIYRVPEVVKLECQQALSTKAGDPCLRVTWGQSGLICGGYRSGLVGVWQISAAATAHYPKEGKTYCIPPIRVFPAHVCPITDLALCPYSDRLLVTSSSERKTKWWDLRGAPVPLRTKQSTIIQSLQWVPRLGGVFYIDDKSAIAFEVPGYLKRANHLRLCRIHNTIKDYSLNLWSFTMAMGSDAGEVILRALPDPMIEGRREKSSSNSDIQVMCVAKVVDADAKKKVQSFGTYEDLAASNSVIIFKDNTAEDKGLRKPQATCRAEYKATAVEKITFNQNLWCFNNLTVAYRCGVVRNLSVPFIEKGIRKLANKINQDKS